MITVRKLDNYQNYIVKLNVRQIRLPLHNFFDGLKIITYNITFS